MKKIFLLLFLALINILTFAQVELNKPQGLIAGDIAPNFSGLDQNGNKINLKDALSKGNVILIFYRGQWCPYCNKQLSQLNDSLSYLTLKGATVLAVTPETAVNIQKTVSKTNASFSIIEDKGLAIMKAYKVNFEVDEKTISKYKGHGIDFEKANGENGANLPVPATYIIDKDGKIKYAYFNTDYRKRVSVKEIVENL
jgi:peroxiredoxin